MPSALPDGEPAPASGELPESALALLDGHPFGIYVHVPFCSVRCGYCDFNTYTLTELGVDGASVATYADAALAELDLAVTVLGPRAPTVSTVFVGGGTPTLLAAHDLVRVLAGIRDRFGLAPGAEVTTEANPDSVTPESLKVLADGGFTRVSIGMQSAVPSVLATLERTHDPANVRARRRRRPCRRAQGERRPDLRHAGGVAAGLARQPRRGGRPAPRPRLGLRAGGRGGDQARGAGTARPGARPRGRRRGGQVRDRRRGPVGGRLPLVRGQQLGARARRTGAGTTRATGPTATGGASVPARTATSVACGGGTSSTPTPLPPA